MVLELDGRIVIVLTFGLLSIIMLIYILDTINVRL